MKRRTLWVVLGLALAACSQGTVETTTLSGGTVAPANESPATAATDAAPGICDEYAWVGIPEPASFADTAADLGLDEVALAGAVRRLCPATFFEPLSKAEVDWCGDGVSFGQNFFRVVAAGVDLGIESFAVVQPGLISKAAGRAELTDYEVELLTSGLQTMSESSRFERDWAAACRSTF